MSDGPVGTSALHIRNLPEQTARAVRADAKRCGMTQAQWIAAVLAVIEELRKDAGNDYSTAGDELLTIHGLR